MPAAISRRGPTKGDQREHALLEAAREVFRVKPIAQVTIDELATAAGIARSGFYFYFESKQALLAALCDQVIGENDAEMAEWNATSGVDRKGLRQGLSRSLARWKVDGRWLREAFLAPDPGPDVMHFRERMIDRGCTAFAERIKRDAAAGLTVGGPPDLLAAMVVNLRLLTMADAYADPGKYADGDLLDTLTDGILRLVYGETPG
jgi:TetR/AcrR family transcriptional regulator, ethionamide resistance regulator